MSEQMEQVELSPEVIEHNRIEELMTFFNGLQRQLIDVKSLKSKYQIENDSTEYVPRWKQTTSEKRQSFGKATSISLVDRNAPDIGQDEAERIYSELPEGHFGAHAVTRQFASDVKEMRRLLFWLTRRRFIKFYTVTQTYMKRTKSEIGKRSVEYPFTTDGIAQKRRVPKRSPE